MPAYIAPIEHTRGFSLRPAGGLRYGNFEGYVHLPPVVDSPKLGAHSYSSLNNQQIYKTVCEWFEGWKSWQQKVLLCGIVNRCSLRQVDILATTLEPLRHRDYVVAVQHYYPTTPLKKIRDRNEKKKKKKRKIKKKRAGPVASETTETTESTQKVSTETGTETTESQLVAIHIEDGAESPVSVIDYGTDQSIAESVAFKIESYLQTAVPHAESLHDYADGLADQILQLALPKPKPQHTLQFAQDLATSVLREAMDTVSKAFEEKEEKVSTLPRLEIKKLEDYIEDDDNGNLKKTGTRHISKGPELSDVPEDMRESKTHTETTPSFRAHSPIVDTIIESRSKSPKLEEALEEDVTEIVKPKRSDSPTSQVRIAMPGLDRDEKNREPQKPERNSHSGVSLSLSAITRSSISKLRYSLFASTAVSTPDFFMRHSKDKLGPSGPGPMQRELRQGRPFLPERMHNVPIPASRLYKSVRWWPEAPREGKIFLKAHKQDLSNNFKDQLQQVWDWMDLWEDYEKIALLKELLKTCGPSNLAFLFSHIQQQLRDTRDVNRMSDKLLLYIFSYMSSEQISILSRVCRRWRFLCATDDLWMIKCHELGLEEGIQNLEQMIIKSKKKKMGIDWHLAYEELRRITQMMKLGFSLSNKKKKDDKKVNFKDQLQMLQQRETEPSNQLRNVKTTQAQETHRKQHVTLSSESETDSEVNQPRFKFRNHIEPISRSPRATLNREELHSLLKYMLFTEGPPPTTDKTNVKGEPAIVELDVLRGTMSAVKKMKKKKHGVEEEDEDDRSVISEDFTQFDNEYKILREEMPEPKSAEKQRSTPRVTMTNTAELTKPTEKTEEGSDKKSGIKLGKLARPPILRKTTEMKDDADAEDAAYDIRPELQPAVDILGKTKPHMSLKWEKKQKLEEEENIVGPEPYFAGMVKSVMRARKLQGHMNGILCVQFDHRRLISAGLDRVIRIWDIRSGRSIHKFFGHKGGIRCLQFIGNELITGSWDTTIMVWDLRNLCRKYILTDHMDSVSCLQFNTDYLVSGSHDHTVRVWRRSTYLCDTVITGHSASVTCLAFDGTNVASGSMDKTIRVNNIITGDCQQVLHHGDDIIHTVLIKGSLIISGDLKGRVHFWNKLNGEREAAIQAHQEPIHKLAFLEGRFFTASGDGTIREWDLLTMTSVRLLQGHKGAVRDIKVSQNRIVSCSDDGSIRIWDLFDPRKKQSVEVQIRQLHQE